MLLALSVAVIVVLLLAGVAVPMAFGGVLLLIAIMGDTYEKVHEQMDARIRLECAKLIVDYLVMQLPSLIGRGMPEPQQLSCRAHRNRFVTR